MTPSQAMKPHPPSTRLAGTMQPCRTGVAGRLVRVLMLALLCLILPATARPQDDPLPAGPDASAPATEPADAATACFDRIWTDYQEDMWFFDARGERVIPEADRTWLVVRLDEGAGEPAAEPPDVPGRLESFNAAYSAYFSHVLHDPALAPSLAAYRLQRDMPPETLRELMLRLRQDQRVRYAHPAWRIDDRLYAPLERIEITWKTATDPARRQALLQKIGADIAGEGAAADRQEVIIDPCRESVWQTAALLAEDILVRQARPLLMPLVPPISVRFALGMQGAAAGTPIPFTLEVRFTDRITLESSTIANLNLKPEGVFHNLYEIRYDAPLSSLDPNRSPLRVTGHLLIYATGEYRIPGVPVYYTDRDAPGTRVQLVKTADLPVRIAALLPETAPGMELQAGSPEPLPPLDTRQDTAARRRSALLALAGLVLLGLAAGLTAVLVRQRRNLARQPENRLLYRLHDAARSALTQVEQQPDRPHLAALGAALRDYLAELAGLPENRRGGSHSAFFRHIETALPEDCRRGAAELLALIDHLLARETAEAVPADLPGLAARLLEQLQPGAIPGADRETPEA